MKLALAGMVGAAVVLYVAYLGFSATWQYYVLVDECQEQADQFCGKRLRVSGKVARGSLSISEDRRRACFLLAGDIHQLRVDCAGPLPDNLAECMEVVVEGVLQEDGHLQGQKVITRCASKYAPKDEGGRMKGEKESKKVHPSSFRLHPSGHPPTSPRNHG